MDKKKTAIRTGAVLVVALAAGHLAQTLSAERSAAKAQPEAIAQVSAGAEKAPPVTDPAIPVSASLGAASLAPVLPAAKPAGPAEPVGTVAEAPVAPTPAEVPVPASLTEDTKEDATAAPSFDAPALPEMGDAAKAEPAVPAAPTTPAPADPAPAVAVTDCTVDLKLTAGPQATISVTLTSPCRAGQRVVLRHAGLAVAETLSDTGSLSLDLPALNTKGEVSALFSDAEIARGATTVPDAATVRRFGVQWMADDAFQLHAMENGADYGQPGHVSTGSPVSPNGGYLLALGDPSLDLPMMAEVYTWPMGSTIPLDVVIEAAVTETTCGRELLGETISVVDGAVVITDLSLATPDCDAVGDILVLKNPGTAVTLAASN